MFSKYEGNFASVPLYFLILLIMHVLQCFANPNHNSTGTLFQINLISVLISAAKMHIWNKQLDDLPTYPLACPENSEQENSTRKFGARIFDAEIRSRNIRSGVFGAKNEEFGLGGSG